MKSPLQKGPNGLLELFRLKTQGEQPTAFDDTVAPSVDVTEAYGQDVQIVSNDSLTNVTVTQTIVATVGLAQRGGARILNASGFIQLGAAAGTQVRMLLGIRNRSVEGLCYIGENVITAPVAGGYYAVVSSLTVAPWLPSGGQIVLEVQGNAAGADHILALRTLQQLLSPDL